MYEVKRWPIKAPDPIEAICFMMEQKGLTRRDLEPAIGARNRVAEILNRKRPLTLPMIRRLEAAASAHTGPVPAEADENLKRARAELIRIYLAGGDVAAFIATPGEHQDVLREFPTTVRHLDETI